MAIFSAFRLRRKWLQHLTFRSPIFPFVLLLIAVQTLWISYDIVITSHEHHRPKREKILVTETSPLTPFYPPAPGMEYAGFRRAFPVWTEPFPCGPLESKHAMQTRTPATEGILYVKEIEASSTELAGITARIARKMGQKQQQANSDRTKVATINNATATVCTTRLNSQRAFRYRDRVPDKSFLWSVVREPADRLLSKFYHYGEVKTKKGSALTTTLSRFQNFVFNNMGTDYGYYFNSLNVHRKMDPAKKDHETDIRELLESYDFLGVSERMDESLAVLKIILNLEIQDILYLPFPKADVGTNDDKTDYYEHWGKGNCRAIPKPETQLEIKEWFYSEEFEAFIEGDVMFYKAVNASLDKTISELGKELVEKTVKQIQYAQKVARNECQNVRFPCSTKGEKQIENDCLFGDVGCGYQCLDELGEKLAKDPGFQALP